MALHACPLCHSEGQVRRFGVVGGTRHAPQLDLLNWHCNAAECQIGDSVAGKGKGSLLRVQEAFNVSLEH